MTELNFVMFEQLERRTIFTPLGIRFWDPVRDTQISDDLVVTARPKTTSRPIVRAFKTESGIYAFQGLPCLYDVEHSTNNLTLGASPPNTKSFIIEVKDKQRRFLPIVFCVDLPLPYNGVFLKGVSCSTTLSSPPASTAPGFYLFSAPTRSAAPGLAVIRGNLVDYSTQRPAAHAVLEVEVKDQKTWYGVADERGCIAILFPYPGINSTLGISPPGTLKIALDQQQWELAIRVRYAPHTLVFQGRSSTPDLRSIWSQSLGVIWPTCLGSPVTESAVQEWSTVLKFGQELILLSEGLPKSELWIDKKI